MGWASQYQIDYVYNRNVEEYIKWINFDSTRLPWKQCENGNRRKTRSRTAGKIIISALENIRKINLLEFEININGKTLNKDFALDIVLIGWISREKIMLNY